MKEWIILVAFIMALFVFQGCNEIGNQPGNGAGGASNTLGGNSVDVNSPAGGGSGSSANSGASAQAVAPGAGTGELVPTNPTTPEVVPMPPGGGGTPCKLLNAQMHGGELLLHWDAPGVVKPYKDGEILACSYAGFTGTWTAQSRNGDVVDFAALSDTAINVAVGRAKCEFEPGFSPPYNVQPAVLNLGGRTCVYNIGFDANGVNTDPAVDDYPDDLMFGWE